MNNTRPSNHNSVTNARSGSTFTSRLVSRLDVALAASAFILVGPLIQAAPNVTHTVSATAASTTNWTAATWTNGTPSSSAGDIASQNTAGNSFTTTLDADVTIGALSTGTGSSSSVWTIASDGTHIFTLDGTGISNTNNIFGNAGVAMIAARGSSTNSNIIVNSAINLATSLDIGTTSTSGSFVTIGGNINNTSGSAKTISIRLNGTGTSSNGSITTSSTIGGSGSAIAISNLSTAAAGTFAINATLGAQVTSITQNSAGVKLSLGGSNASWTGPIDIKAGTVKVTTVDGLGGGTVTLGDSTVGANAALELAAGNVTIAKNFTVASGAGTRTLALGSSNSFTYSGAVTLNNDLLISANIGTLTDNLTGGITGTGNVSFTNDLNTRTGTVNINTVALNNAGTVTNASLGTTAVNLAAGLGANVTGLVQNSNVGSTTTLSGSNTTFAGTVTVIAGTLKLNNTAALGVNNAVTVNGGTLDVNNNNQTIGSLAGSGGTVTNANNAVRTLTVGGNNTSTSYDGVITASTPANLALTKTGTGTQTLNGTNLYAGSTTISNGTLIVGGAGSINASSGVSVGATSTFINNSSVAFSAPITFTSGAKFGGSGTFAGTIIATNGSTLAPGSVALVATSTTFSGSLSASGTATLSLNLLANNSSDAVLTSGTGTLNFTNFNLKLTAGYALTIGDTYTIASSASTISGTFLNDSGGTVSDLAGNTYTVNYGTNAINLTVASVSAVPEPFTYAAIAGVLVLGLGVYRRRRLGAA